MTAPEVKRQAAGIVSDCQTRVRAALIYDSDDSAAPTIQLLQYATRSYSNSGTTITFSRCCCRRYTMR